jgi:hypothetical protein
MKRDKEEIQQAFESVFKMLEKLIEILVKTYD